MRQGGGCSGARRWLLVEGWPAGLTQERQVQRRVRCTPTPSTQRFPTRLPLITSSAAKQPAATTSSWQAQTASSSTSSASSTPPWTRQSSSSRNSSTSKTRPVPLGLSKTTPLV